MSQKKKKKQLVREKEGQIPIPKITLVGVGGAGGNAASRMVNKLHGVNFVAVNTDIQDLRHTTVKHKIQIGKNATKGLGAGMDPVVGRQAAEEDKEEIAKALIGAQLVFITCGLGGGTGSGASPVIAEIAKEAGALTIAVITKPFVFEGKERMRIADDAWKVLADKADAIITISNDRIFNLIARETSLNKSFAMIDDVLRQGVQALYDIIVRPGIVNIDFSDIKTILQNAGPSLLGTAKGSGENRAEVAARAAANSLLLDLTIEGAKAIIFHVAGHDDLGMAEINEAARVITETIDPEARIIFGATVDERLNKNEIKITVVATGFQSRLNLPVKVNNAVTTRALNFARSSDEPRQDFLDQKEALNEILREDEKKWEEPPFLRRKK